MKYLCHAGPWSDEYFSFIVAAMDSEADCHIVSGHKNVDTTGLVEKYYEFLRFPTESNSSPTSEELDIIYRCRLLRALSVSEAMRHLVCMRKAMEYVFDTLDPDIAITETVDSFIIDLFCKESEKRGIPCIGLVTVFVNGLCRVSIRGEYNKCRNVSEEEVNNVTAKLTNLDYLPAFVAKDTKQFRYRVLRKWLRNAIKIPYFAVKRITSGDYYNYHYWHSIIICRSWFNWLPRLDIATENWEEKIKQATCPIVYLPLQMFPEATIDYWCDDVSVIDYENVLLSVVERYQGLTFLVKEHPNVAGHRKVAFYNKLKRFNNVIVCPTEVPSNSLEHMYQSVLVWTGTVGFEAAIRGKPLLCMSHPYYFSDDSMFCRISADTSEESIINYIRNYNHNTNPSILVRHVLEGCLIGKVHFDGSWSRDNTEHCAEAKKLAASIKEYIYGFILPS